VTQTCFYHLHRIRDVRRQLLGGDITVTALVLSRLDYCNAVLAGLSASTLAPFQRVLHAAARTGLDLMPRDHVTPAVQELHWLSVAEREDPVQTVFANPQVASWTHARVHLGLADITSRRYTRTICTACLVV